MSLCVVDNKHCQCSPIEGFPCAAVEELRKDAERYRWLRDSANLDGPHIYGPDDDSILDCEDADRAVDAAMAATPAIW